MKNVAATSGQSVNLATLFFAEGMTWEGMLAGSDIVLNFFLSSSSGDSRSQFFRSKLAFRRIQALYSHARKKCISVHIFSKPHLNVRTGKAPPILRYGLPSGVLRFFPDFVRVNSAIPAEQGTLPRKPLLRFACTTLRVPRPSAPVRLPSFRAESAERGIPLPLVRPLGSSAVRFSACA